MKISSKDRNDSKRPEKTIAHSHRRYRLTPRTGTQEVSRLVVRLHRGEDLVQTLPVEVVRIREIGSRKHRGVLRNVHQPRRVPIRQRTDQRSIDKTKDGRAGANPERQDENRCNGESRTFTQLSKRVADVLK